jgi:ATP-dependent DNA helicase PIF1
MWGVWPLQSNPKVLGVPEDSQVPILGVWISSSHSLKVELQHQGKGVVFFLDGLGGSGKTFVYSVLLALVRRDGHVAIRVASFGIVAFPLEGGRNSHSIFKIPIAIGRDSMCLTPVQNNYVELLQEAKLIIWDEAST